MKNKLLVLLMPIRSVLFVLIFVVAAAVSGRGLEGVANIWSVAASVLNIVTIVALVFVSRNHGGFSELIGLKKGVTSAKQIVGMIFLVLFVGMFFMYLAGFLCYGIIPYGAPMMIAPVPAVLAVINLLVLPVSTALAEDSLYLGCGVRQIDNKYLSIIVPAFFFAVQHCFIPMLFDLRFMAYRFLSFLPLTVILCIHYRKHQNPLPIMIGHAVIDLASSGMILLTSVVPGVYEKMLELAGG